MTDNEIIKALECCIEDENGCPTDCPLWNVYGDCFLNIQRPMLDLINRQKAEKETMQSYIDCLKAEVKRLEQENFDRSLTIETWKWEAVKDFAERLKDKSYLNEDLAGFEDMVVDVDDIDNLVKEMVGEG